MTWLVQFWRKITKTKYKIILPFKRSNTSTLSLIVIVGRRSGYLIFFFSPTGILQRPLVAVLPPCGVHCRGWAQLTRSRCYYDVRDGGNTQTRCGKTGKLRAASRLMSECASTDEPWVTTEVCRMSFKVKRSFFHPSLPGQPAWNGPHHHGTHGGSCCWSKADCCIVRICLMTWCV